VHGSSLDKAARAITCHAFYSTVEQLASSDCLLQRTAQLADVRPLTPHAGCLCCCLQEFVKKGVEWAHLDIAGPVWDEKASLPTGYGAALLAEWATNQGA
jgi:leucyl aminopeptidase